MRYFVFFSFLMVITSSLAIAAPTDSVKVIVIDEKENPVGDVKVSIQDNSTYTSNPSGFFKFKPSKKLVLPFNISVTKKGYELEEFSYYENEKEIEVRIKKSISSSKDFLIHTVSPAKSPLANVHILYNGKNYITDNLGNIKVSEKKFSDKLFASQGFKVDDIKFAEDTRTYTIQLSPSLVETPVEHKVVSNHVAPVPADTGKAVPSDEVAKKELEEKVFKQYQEDFTNLSSEIIEERARLVESNKLIRGEIERLTSKLQNEKNLSPEKRAQLQSNIETLEKNLIENAIAYNKAEEKTLGMIQNLKMLVMQKDSINAITVKKLHAEEKKRMSVEKKAKRTLIIFTIITISLVFLGVVFYSIARKMRSQRTALLKSNEELKKLKEQYEKGIKQPY